MSTNTAIHLMKKIKFLSRFALLYGQATTKEELILRQLSLLSEKIY